MSGISGNCGSSAISGYFPLFILIYLSNYFYYEVKRIVTNNFLGYQLLLL